MKKRRRRSKAPESYISRDYRAVVGCERLVSSYVRLEQTDLHILADQDVGELAQEAAMQARQQIERYISRVPAFLTSLKPLRRDQTASPLIQQMLTAAECAGVGPMAAVAGAIAGYVGRRLIEYGVQEVIVENVGDIYLHRQCDSTIGIFAGESPLSYSIGIRIAQGDQPCGVCTSSGTIGHSLSFGVADSVTVVADSIALADAVATRLGNEVGRAPDRKASIGSALEVAQNIEGIRGVVIICDDVMGACGDVELVRLG